MKKNLILIFTFVLTSTIGFSQSSDYILAKKYSKLAFIKFSEIDANKFKQVNIKDWSISNNRFYIKFNAIYKEWSIFGGYHNKMKKFEMYCDKNGDHLKLEMQNMMLESPLQKDFLGMKLVGKHMDLFISSSF